jgi:hypothetical protein
MRSLLQSVERLLKTTYIVRARSINKAWWLLTVDHFIQVAIEKGILDI